MATVFLLVGWVAPQASAQVESNQFFWGGSVFAAPETAYFTSTGTAIPGGSGSGYKFDVGYFTAGFTPTAANIATWNTNWNSLSTPATSFLIDVPDYSFGGENLVTSLASNGLSPYIFVYDANGFLGQAGGQAFLGTSTTWEMMPFGGTEMPRFYYIDEMDTVIFGSANTDYYGAGNVLTGGGTLANSPALYEMQLGGIAPVPEPSGALLIASVGIVSLLRRSRRSVSRLTA